jgi:transcriptional regulator with XRE-family HTH domain/tetratricopeptide (TPR) repeat protein
MEPVEPGALTPLQAARLDKGWKAAKLAAELGVSETTLSRWENGRQQPTLGHQQRLCEVLDKDPVELGFQGDILEVGTRREFMRQVTALVGTATMETVLDVGGPDALDWFSLALGHPTQVDRATVQHLETVTATHRELYHHLSSLELVDAVTGHLRGVTRLLRGAQHRVLRRRLAAVAGETAGHAAWLFHDLGDQKATERYYADAAIATRKAGDPALDAYVSGFKSLVRASDGEPKTALALARAARQTGARSATATTRAWLAGLEAQALASLHDNKACFVALRQAEAAIGQARPDEDPPWMYSFDEGRLAALAGTCYRQLGKLTAAERTLQGALEGLDASRTRRRSEVLLELALVQLEKEDIDKACRFATQSYEAVVEAGSVLGQRRVGAFRSRLDRWSDAEAVRNLDEQLAGLL